MTRYIHTAEIAKMIRSALKAAFPSVKFSVRSHVYTGGSSIRVGWTDGPTAKMVGAVVNKFQGGRFDGSIDMAYSVDHYITKDGEIGLLHNPGTVGSAGSDPGFTTQLPEGAEKVHFCVSHIFTNREVSPAMYGRALSKIVSRYALGDDNCEDVTVETTKWGSAQLSRDPYLPGWNANLSDLIHRDLVKRCAAL